MAWKRFFRSTTSNLTTPSDTTYPAQGNSSAKYASYLPEVYAGHPNRIQRYYQYDDMDRDSDINAALDTIADFCTQSEEQNDEPFDVAYLSKATETEVKLIKEYLEKWVKLQNFRSRLWNTFRNAIKYGDQIFLRDPETMEWLWVDVFMVEMVKMDEAEGKKPEEYIIRGLTLNKQSKYATVAADPQQYRTPLGTSNAYGGRPAAPSSGGPAAFSLSGANADPRQRTALQGMNSQLFVVDAKHVVHLSLSAAMDVNFPFGQSILEPIFKTYKQKELLEDAAIIYRVQRAPERRVFSIDVGQMPLVKQKQYLEQFKQEIHSRRIPNRTGGGQCFDMSTKVPLLDGRVLTISELSNEFSLGKTNWAYSCDPNTGNIVPGKITWAGITRKNAQVLRITLDNGEEIICTPDHKFPIWNKGFIEAQNIIPNVDSLFSFNKRLYSISEKNNLSDPQYEQIWDHKLKKWVFTHRMVANFMKDKNLHEELIFEIDDFKKSIIHHKDFDKYNNCPDNLAFMNGYDHFLLHGHFSKNMIDLKSDDEKKEIRRKCVIGNKVTWKKRKEDTDNYQKYLKNLSSISKKRANTPKYKEILINNLSEEMAAPWRNQSNKWDNALFDKFLTVYKNHKCGKKELSIILSQDNEFMTLYREVNFKLDKTINKLNYSKFSVTTLEKLIKANGFESWENFIEHHDQTIKKPTLGIKVNHELISKLVSIVNNNNSDKATTCKLLTENKEFMELYKTLNSDTKGMSNKSKISFNTLDTMLRKSGYQHWGNFKKNIACFNHKIVKIEWLEDKQDTGTITIDGNEEFHDYHTFALNVGVFTKNSILDAAYNPMCFDMSTKIPLLDGRTLTIDEIAVEYRNGKENWVYSCDPITGEIMPGNITWAGVTQESAKVIRIKLDNNKTIICTPTHKIPVLGRGFVEAKDLTPEDSLIAFNTQYKNIDRKLKNERTYHQVYDHSQKEWIYTHRMVGEFFRKINKHQEFTFLPDYKGTVKQIIHHKDYDRYNNDPRNLQYMNKEDHLAFHVAMKKDFWQNLNEKEATRIKNKISTSLKSYFSSLSESEREELSDAAKKRFVKIFTEMQAENPEKYEKWKKDSTERLKTIFAPGTEAALRRGRRRVEFGGKVIKNQTLNVSQKMDKMIVDLIKSQNPTRIKAAEILSTDVNFMEELKKLNKPIDGLVSKIDLETISPVKLDLIIEKLGYQGWRDCTRKISNYNHRIVSIEYLEEPIQVGTITVDGKERWHKHHTFAIEQGIFVKNSMIEDYFLAVSSDGRGSKIDVLPGGQSTGEIEDLSWFSKKLARGLRIPPSYLSIGDDSSQVSYNDGKLGAALIQEFRFNKYCMRLQNLLSQVFDKEFKYYLEKNGIEIDSSIFELRFNPPQNFTKYRQIEIDAQQMQVYTSIQDNKRLSERFKFKRFLNLSEDEILENEQMWIDENPDAVENHTGQSPADMNTNQDLSDVGIRPGGDDFGLDMDNEPPPEGGEEPGAEPNGAGPSGPETPPPPAPGTPT